MVLPDPKPCDEFVSTDGKQCSTCGRGLQYHRAIIIPVVEMTREEVLAIYPMANLPPKDSSS